MTARPPLAVPDFETPAEFAALCRLLARRLHGKNRIAMGESGFVFQIAEVIDRAGAAFARHWDDAAIRAAFGDGWSEGAVAQADQPAALLTLLYPETPPQQG